MREKEIISTIAKKEGFNSTEEMLASRRAKGYYNFGIDENNDYDKYNYKYVNELKRGAVVKIDGLPFRILTNTIVGNNTKDLTQVDK